MTAQTQIDFARAARDSGMQRATAHADEVSPSWSERAFGHFRTFVSQQTEPFRIEQFRDYVAGILPTPPSLRAYGAIAVRAVKSGLIVKAGFAPTQNIKSHRTPVTVWRKV